MVLPVMVPLAVLPAVSPDGLLHPLRDFHRANIFATALLVVEFSNIPAILAFLLLTLVAPTDIAS